MLTATHTKARIKMELKVTFDEKHLTEQEVNLLLDSMFEMANENYDVELNIEIVKDDVPYTKVVSVEIDSKLFCDEIDYEHSSWFIDASDIDNFPKIKKYLETYEPENLEALRNGTLDYIEVYRYVS